MSQITKEHILYKKTKIDLIGLLEHERKLRKQEDLQAKKTIELLSQKISDLQSTNNTPVNPNGLDIQLEPPPLDLSQSEESNNELTLEQNLHDIIKELKTELDTCKSQIKYASAKKYYKLEEEHNNLKQKEHEWKERESAMCKDFEELRKSYTDFKLQLEELHSIKNKKGEFWLGQVYPPGIVGFKEMCDGLDYHMFSEPDGLKAGNFALSGKLKEKEQELEKVYSLMKQFSNLLHDCRE